MAWTVPVVSQCSPYEGVSSCMDDKVILWGNKVSVRSMRKEDVEKMIHWSSHEELLFYDYNFPYMDIEEREQWFDLKTKGHKRCFSVFDSEGEMVGYTAIRNVNVFFKRAELGIVFDPGKISSGYGTDAMRTLLKWYFNDLKYRKMILTVAAYNERAIKSYTKVGFTKYAQHYGEFMNTMVNPLVEDEFKDFRKYFKKKGNKLDVLYYKMQISKLSTD